MQENDRADSPYRSYRAEFMMLRESGCRLFYPGRHEIAPNTMAATMAHDRRATYMRDMQYDEDGRPREIYFQRVSI